MKKNNMTFSRLLTFMTKPWVVVFYFGAICLLIFYFDKPFSSYVYHLDLRSHIPLLSVVTRLGLSVLYFPTFIFLIFFFRYIHINRKWEARSFFLLLCISIPAGICGLIKPVLGRARPNLFIHEQIYGFYGFKWHANFWSCPSGHTTTIISVVLGLSILFPRYLAAFLLTGVLVALSRVLLTHHYLSDILIAFYLVLLELGILLYVLRKNAWLTPVWKRDMPLATEDVGF